MKIAIIYNRNSQKVINLFGLPNREKYGKKSIQRIIDGLKKHKHQVKAFEGDKDIIHKLEEFMPRVLKGERPGMVFNLSYGIQGQARYTHVPGILEMVGIPYIGSGPLAHSLALDKVVAKMIFRQHGLPTPDFTVLDAPGFPAPGLTYPLIVKPKNEAVSMGLKVVHNEAELREAAQNIFDTFRQPVLVEEYIEGREINVGLLGNNPPETLPPCEIVFGEGGPNIYTIEDKKGKSGREIQWLCPAPLDEAVAEKARELARRAFTAIGCYDTARVDMRLDAAGNLFLLEINSLPSLGEHGSYVIAAERVGLDFPALLNRLVEVASARYFGTPSPPKISPNERNPETLIFTFLTQRRDQMEKRLKEWSLVSSRTADPIGNSTAISRLDDSMREIKMKPVTSLTDSRSVYTWETEAGLAGGTLFIGHIDVPLELNAPAYAFRLEPEWFYGEGIGISRAPLVMLEFSLRALRHSKLLHRLPIGVLYYLDEGRDCRYSADIIRTAASKAKQVFILRPGSPPDYIRVQRRGRRTYRLVAEGKPQRIGQPKKTTEVVLWFAEKLSLLRGLLSREERLALAAVDISTEAFPMRVPHRLKVMLVLSYFDPVRADDCEAKIREILGRPKGIRLELEKISDRPPMPGRRESLLLAKRLEAVAGEWNIPLNRQSSVMQSAGGLVPSEIPVICGIGPVARDLNTPHEAVNRGSIIQRTLLMTQFLAREITQAKEG
ncbi:MAG: ATP-grasp domain-containing protein [bacterium]